MKTWSFLDIYPRRQRMMWLEGFSSSSEEALFRFTPEDLFTFMLIEADVEYDSAQWNKNYAGRYRTIDFVVRILLPFEYFLPENPSHSPVIKIWCFEPPKKQRVRVIFYSYLCACWWRRTRSLLTIHHALLVLWSTRKTLAWPVLLVQACCVKLCHASLRCNRGKTFYK